MVMVVADPLPSALLGTIAITYTSPTRTSFSVYIVSLVFLVLIMAPEAALMTLMKLLVTEGPHLDVYLCGK